MKDEEILESMTKSGKFYLSDHHVKRKQRKAHVYDTLFFCANKGVTSLRIEYSPCTGSPSLPYAPGKTGFCPDK